MQKDLANSHTITSYLSIVDLFNPKYTTVLTYKMADDFAYYIPLLLIFRLSIRLIQSTPQF